MKIAVLIPCYNEELTVKSVVEDFRRAIPGAEIYVFDNNSKDRTAEIARSAGAIVVHSPRQGKGYVVQHMFDSVDADLYVMTDGDSTYPAAKAPELLEVQRATGADMVVGCRKVFLDQKVFRRFHRFGNDLVAGLISWLFGQKVTDVMSGFRVFTRRFVKTVPLRTAGFEIETEMTLQALAKGFSLREHAIEYGSRPEGSFSKLNTYQDGFLVLRLILVLFKDYKPLWFFMTIAALLACLSLASGYGPIMDFVHTGLVPKLPRAVLASALAILSALSGSVGLVLDTAHRYHLEDFALWRRSIENGMSKESSK